MADKITDETRREVARRLRDGWVPYEAVCSVLGREETRTQWEESLAELIDRPTCENISGGRAFRCSCCEDEYLDDLGFYYCPTCGAEVVEEVATKAKTVEEIYHDVLEDNRNHVFSPDRSSL